MSTLKVDTILKRTGTGTITVGQSGDTIALPAATLTTPLPAASGGTGSTTAPNNTPAFFASLSSNTSTSSGSYTKLVFDNEVFDSDNKYDTSNGRFTPGVAGKYYIGAKHRIDTSTNATATILAIYKNGSTFQRARFTLDNSEEYFFACVLDLDADDYVEVYAYQNSGGSVNVSGGTLGSDDTVAFMFGYKLIGA